MNKLIIAIFSFFVLGNTCLVAQNNVGKADDADRLAIAPVIDEESSIPQAAQNLLNTRMLQIITKNGMAAEPDKALFFMKALVNEISKDITPTSPPMHAYNLEVVLSVVDKLTGNVAHTTSYEVRGVGSNETKAYIQGIKQLNASSPQMRKFVDESKTKILEYYNSNCDNVIKYTETLVQQGNKNEAIDVLEGVPNISKECYMKCQEKLATIEPIAEPTEIKTNDTDNTALVTESAAGQGGSAQVLEIKEGVFLSYIKNKTIGEKLIVDFQFDNTTSEDVVFSLYINDIKLYDEDGNVKPCKLAKFTNQENTYVIKGTILPDTPASLTLEFDKAASIKVINIEIFRNTFRYNDIPIQ